jgi:hypothetical protein
MRPASEIMQPWFPVDTVSINGRKGIRYFIGDARHHSSAMPLVISRDPSLTRLAIGHQRLAAMQESSFPGADSPKRVSFREVIVQGAPTDLFAHSWSRSAAPPSHRRASVFQPSLRLRRPCARIRRQCVRRRVL